MSHVRTSPNGLRCVPLVLLLALTSQLLVAAPIKRNCWDEYQTRLRQIDAELDRQIAEVRKNKNIYDYGPRGKGSAEQLIQSLRKDADHQKDLARQGYNQCCGEVAQEQREEADRKNREAAEQRKRQDEQAIAERKRRDAAETADRKRKDDVLKAKSDADTKLAASIRLTADTFRAGRGVDSRATPESLTAEAERLREEARQLHSQAESAQKAGDNKTANALHDAADAREVAAGTALTEAMVRRNRLSMGPASPVLSPRDRSDSIPGFRRTERNESSPQPGLLNRAADSIGEALSGKTGSTTGAPAPNLPAVPPPLPLVQPPTLSAEDQARLQSVLPALQAAQTPPAPSPIAANASLDDIGRFDALSPTASRSGDLDITRFDKTKVAPAPPAGGARTFNPTSTSSNQFKPLSGNVTVTYINGVCNNESTAGAAAQELANRLGATTSLQYLQTRSQTENQLVCIPLDGGRAANAMLSRRMSGEAQAIHNQMKAATERSQPYYAVGHSAGTIHLQNAAVHFVHDVLADQKLDQSEKARRLQSIHIVAAGSPVPSSWWPTELGSVNQLVHEDDGVARNTGPGDFVNVHPGNVNAAHSFDTTYLPSITPDLFGRSGITTIRRDGAIVISMPK